MLVQEREKSEKLRVRVRELELSIEQQQQQQQQRVGRDQLDSSQRLVSESSQDELKRSSTHDVKALKLKVRLGEEKNRELEKDVEKKVKIKPTFFVARIILQPCIQLVCFYVLTSAGLMHAVLLSFNFPSNVEFHCVSIVFCLDEWQDIRNCFKGNKLHSIYSTIGIVTHRKTTSRRDSVVINRL